MKQTTPLNATLATSAVTSVGQPLVMTRWPYIIIGLCALTLIVGGWFRTYQSMESLQAQAFASAERSLADVTRLTQEHAIRTFRGADQALRFVIARYEAEGSKLDLKQLVEQGVIDGALFNLVGIIDAQGIYILSNIPFKKGLDLSDREHFKVHVQTNTQQLFVSKPVLGRASGKWSIQLSRRINLPNGDFGGVAVVSIEAQYFTRFYADLTDDANELTALLGLDGVIRVRQLGRQESFGESIVSSPAIAMALAGTQVGSYTGISKVDNVERLQSYRVIPGYPLITLKGLSTQSIRNSYAPAKDAMLVQTGIATLLMLLAAAVLSLYMSRLRRALGERQLAAYALHVSEERLELALIGGEQGAWDWDISTDSLYVSPLLLKMLGVDSNEGYLSQNQRFAAIHPNDRAAIRAQLIAHLGGKSDLFQMEMRILCSDDCYKWVMVRGKVVAQKDGRSTRLAGSATDISAQRFAQDQAVDRSAQLDAIFTLSPDAFVSFDAARRVKYVNPAFTKMTGMSKSSVNQLSEEEFSAKLAKLCVPGKPFRGVEALRLEATAMDESYHDVIELPPPNKSVLKVSLKLSTSASVSEILYLRDITHESIVEEMKTEFLSTAAHELRTPLASVLGFAEVLLTHELDTATQQEFLNIILKQAQLLSTILDELLDLARIEARQGKDFTFETVELQALVQEVVQAYKCPQGRAAPVVNLTTTFCRVDVGKAKQVLLNVISNAYKYSPAGAAVTISMRPATHSADGTKSWVGLAVSDEGIGMSPSQLERVFERFYRADTSGTVLGTGLGMSIVKEIMDLHGGWVAVESTQGTGTSVTLMFEQATEATP